MEKENIKSPKRYLVTAALPYANGPLHIGHMAGVYIPSDVFVRYLRQNQKDILFVGGSDEHGIPITIRAKKENKTPQQLVDFYHKMNKKILEDFAISFDIFSRTSNKIHYETSSEFFLNLHKKNILIEKEEEQFYDNEAKEFLADRYVVGTCPKCKSEGAYGDQCEKCGSTLSPNELINPKSSLTGSLPIKKKTTHWYMPLDTYQTKISNWLNNFQESWKKSVMGQCRSWLEDGLKPRAITRDLSWGVPVPLKDAIGKVLYVWFDAPIGYISATKELTKDWELYWKDKDSQLIHFVGKDNIVFHCIIFPSMLMAHGDYILPSFVPANEFMNLEGNKISTSRNLAVWANEYLQEMKDKQDEMRYVLLSNCPEQKDSDFSWVDFQNRVNNELVAVLGNFVNRVITLINANYNGIVPNIDISNVNRFEVSKKQLLNIKRELEKNIEGFRFRDALKNMIDIAREGNRYLAEREPWKLFKTNPKEVEEDLFFLIQVVGMLSIICKPFLPFASAKIMKALSLVDDNWVQTDNFENIIKQGAKLGSLGLIFSKISDEEIEFQKNKLNIMINPEKQVEKTPEITIEDLIKVEIKTGTVVNAERVEKSDKLLKLTINDGINKDRIILSGIAKHYTPEDMINRQIIFVSNLKPRKMMGMESNGMVLMAEDSAGKLILVSPINKTEDGLLIK